ncbi:unnamed protein product [Arabis nemorensis]|uniref:Protein kinase domain-containing protein n=1 Tax=Arabis nemorensis TaxID=586526 RepID=A0A565CKQ4_9BRAS|nr:unnamed protein product [Arabis nemorensis]
MGNGLKLFKEEPLSFVYEPLINPPISEMEEENENLRVFSFKELKKATKNFSRDRVEIGEDISVRKFYKGYITKTTFATSRTETGIAVYVVECPKDRSQAQQEWMDKVKKSLGQFSHPNLVKLLGYCCEDNKSLFLVFEYLHKGSLDRYIFGNEVLPWELRVNIAIGTAKGLAFIHSVKNSSVHLEIRMHKIMLDEQYNAKLFYCDLNQKCLVDEKGRVLAGGFGYVALELAMTGHIGTEADVYTFGVILLELLTGLKAFDTERSDDKRSLAVWTKSYLSNKIGEIIDPRFGNDYPVNAATQMGKLIKRCIAQDKNKRPLMQQVLDGLNDIAEMKD